ncbi:hypothetical protein [Flavobacterium litorale]|uniref:Uncharacterized protein n=1 Tax=Flavobacterium litorale TaxID=2856519 RepID=A0ABX8VF47_9FLAO|nr:hypothetical protein [Flavobacterium litorale]QYJ69236.1 hypothetical protein K1I41_04930 [Flavobacterium litorale]
MKKLSLINTLLLFGIIAYLTYQHFDVETETDKQFIPELSVERLNVIGKDKNLYMAISNPERQALATMGGDTLFPNTKRDLSGIMFFNRVGDEVGGIFYDGNDTISDQGITFDQQKNDQVMAIMKSEYKEGNNWKRWYGMYLRERTDSITQTQVFKNFYKETENFTEEEKEKAYTEMRRKLDEEINVYRMFLGREETENVGLFLYDSKGRERIKLYVDDKDNAKLIIKDTLGNIQDLTKI